MRCFAFFCLVVALSALCAQAQMGDSVEKQAMSLEPRFSESNAGPQKQRAEPRPDNLLPRTKVRNKI